MPFFPYGICKVAHYNRVEDCICTIYMMLYITNGCCEESLGSVVFCIAGLLAWNDSSPYSRTQVYSTLSHLSHLLWKQHTVCAVTFYLKHRKWACVNRQECANWAQLSWLVKRRDVKCLGLRLVVVVCRVFLSLYLRWAITGRATTCRLCGSLLGVNAFSVL